MIEVFISYWDLAYPVFELIFSLIFGFMATWHLYDYFRSDIQSAKEAKSFRAAVIFILLVLWVRS